jgi:hypothetical protein
MKVQAIIVFILMAICGAAQAGDSAPKKVPLSLPATATVSLNGVSINVAYSAPAIRSRAIMGGLVAYDKVWRTGANAATTLKTDAPLKIGDVLVPAGTYTLYTLPSAEAWLLIINRQTGQWGTVYKKEQDLARVKMKKSELPSAQEVMTISFENTVGKKTELHIRWEKTDVSVPVASHVDAQL